MAHGADDGVFADREQQRELHSAVCAFEPLVHVGTDLVVGLGEGDLEYHPWEHAHAAVAHGEVRVGLFHEPGHFSPYRGRVVAEGQADVGCVAELDQVFFSLGDGAAAREAADRLGDKVLQRVVDRPGHWVDAKSVGFGIVVVTTGVRLARKEIKGSWEW